MRGDRITQLVLIGVGFWVALWRLSVPTSVGDEVVYRRAAADMLAGDWSRNLEQPLLAKELLAAAHVVLVPAGIGDLMAARLVGAACFIATGLVLASVGYQVGGRWAGVWTSALWWVLPLAPGVLVQHVDRYALLEAPMLLFTAAAGAWGVRLVRAPTTAAWACAGLCVGLATASKLTGALSASVLLVPAVTELAQRGAHGAQRIALAAVTCVGVFLLAYVPLGSSALTGVRTAVVWQVHHASRGHPQTVAGSTYLHPPWWAPWWFQAQYLGWLGLAALWAAAAVGAGVLLRSRAGAGQVIGLAVSAAAVSTMSIKLPHYSDVLMPYLALLAACALVRLAAAARRHEGWPRAVALGAVAALLVPLGVRAAAGVAATAGLRPGDYRLVAERLRSEHLASAPVTVWGDTFSASDVLPRARVTSRLPAGGEPQVLVVDDSIAGRLAGADVARWRHEHASDYHETTYGRVSLYVRS